ncbi:hypothetical protein FEM48_Zijuj01G0038000 [Ziziphus jujuba var. spinosa]|uniref:TCP domain-containing protein n=1 Tax=Ziziphus jujuba var. spinosa TaxID=714518 RepID=A0A978VYZ4_ZIZJJ|nr:hypothetical protein FEM48_Zijuj01G0038000 [Ziziphus jujuba var. spinosa]
MRGKLFQDDRANSSRKRCCSTRLERLKENELHQNHPFSKLRLENEAGEGLQVNGGRIIRSIGRKDRHSKVRTSKGPRDRRVRLSAHTAIQFYDVQDRLGFDRPSKAIDWLIDKAKAAIEALAEQPTENLDSLNVDDSIPHTKHLGKQSIYQHPSNFSISGSTPSSSNQFQDYPPEENSIQDLCVSLQPLKAPVFDVHLSSPIDSDELALDDLNASVMGGQFQGLIDWNSNNAGVERDGSFFDPSSAISPQQPVLSQQHHLFTQRGPLHSSNLLPLHAWTDPPISINDHGQTQSPTSHSVSSIGFSGGFLGI